MGPQQEPPAELTGQKQQLLFVQLTYISCREEETQTELQVGTFLTTPDEAESYCWYNSPRYLQRRADLTPECTVV